VGDGEDAMKIYRIVFAMQLNLGKVECRRVSDDPVVVLYIALRHCHAFAPPVEIAAEVAGPAAPGKQPGLSF
jgi:hypothetical protein